MWPRDPAQEIPAADIQTAASGFKSAYGLALQARLPAEELAKLGLH
jgi:hypothetical protein